MKTVTITQQTREAADTARRCDDLHAAQEDLKAAMAASGLTRDQLNAIAAALPRPTSTNRLAVTRALIDAIMTAQWASNAAK